MSQLPEKYKAIGDSFWTIDQAEDLPLAVIEDNEFGYGVCEIGERTDENLAKAALIADAPMLACRVAELENIISSFASITISDMNRWGPEATVERIVTEAHQILAASPFGLAAAPESQSADESAAQ